MAILKPLTFKQTKLKEFRERLSEYCSWELEGTSTTDRLERREQFESFLSSTIDEAERAMVKKIRTEWHQRIDEVKDGLEEEYGTNGNYSPNYEGIIESIFEAKLGGVKE